MKIIFALAKSLHNIWLKPNLVPNDLYPQAKASIKEMIKTKNNLNNPIIIGI